MPTKKKTGKASAGVLPKLPKEVLDLLPSGVMTAGQIEEMTGGLKKALIERALGAELSQHLGYGSGEERPTETGNQRNGTSKKTVLTSDSPVQLDVPMTVWPVSSRSWCPSMSVASPVLTTR